MTSEFLRIGHRGAAAYATENTLSSIQTAIACNVDMVEVDVRRTKDGQLVLWHDTHLKAEERKLKIRRNTLEQLHHLCLPGGELIATLEQALKFAKGKVKVNIDVKERGFEEELVRLVADLDMNTEVMFSGLHLKSLQKIKLLNPSVFVVLSFPSSSLIRLYEVRYLRSILDFIGRRQFTMKAIDFVIRQLLPFKAKGLKVDLGIDGVMIRAPFISSKLVDVVHKKELKLYAWPADEEQDVHKLRQMGVDGAGSNRPDILHLKNEHLAR